MMLTDLFQMINEAREWPDLEKGWFNADTNEIILIKRGHHLQDVFDNPDRYGIDLAQWGKIPSSGNQIWSEQHLDYLFDMGWVRYVRDKHHLDDKNILYMMSNNFTNMVKVIAYFVKRSKIDKVVIDRFSIARTTGARINGSRKIRKFVQTYLNVNQDDAMFLLESKQFPNRVGWFNSKTKEIIDLKQTNHLGQLIDEPERFGISKEQFHTAPVEDKAWSPYHFDLAFQNGWVRFWSSSVEENILNVHTNELKFAIPVIEWFARRGPIDKLMIDLADEEFRIENDPRVIKQIIQAYHRGGTNMAEQIINKHKVTS